MNKCSSFLNLSINQSLDILYSKFIHHCQLYSLISFRLYILSHSFMSLARHVRIHSLSEIEVLLLLGALKVQLKHANAYCLLSRARWIRISLSKPSKIDLLCLINITSTREMPSPLSRPTLHVTPRSRRSPSSKFPRTGLPRMLCIRC